VLIALVAALVGLGLAAGSKTAPDHPAAGQAAPGYGTASPAARTARAANPVTILRQLGAHVPAGERYGDHDVLGNRMAQGTFGPRGWENITVWTAPDRASYAALTASGDARPDDYTGVILLPARRAVIAVYAWQDNGPHYAPGGVPVHLAHQVHGTLVHP